MFLLLPLSHVYPHFSSPLAAAMECPWSSHIRAQTWLLPLACCSSGSLCFLAFPQQLLPWKSQDILTGTRCAGVLLVELHGPIPSPGAGAGRTFLQAGILPGPSTSITSPPFPMVQPELRLLGWGAGDCLCQGTSLGKWNQSSLTISGQSLSWPRAAIASPGTRGLVGLYRMIVTCNFL